jgi:hypothetical protein
MTGNSDPFVRRDQIIAGLLWYGTWAASAVIAVGMALGLSQQATPTLLPGLSGVAVVTAGIALFILLPVARVALMLLIFLRERDYAYTAIAALVLAIIAAGVVAGL